MWHLHKTFIYSKMIMSTSEKDIYTPTISTMLRLVVLMLTVSCRHTSASTNTVKDLMKAAITSALQFTDDKNINLVYEYEEKANQLDYDDCGKKLICMLATKSDFDLEWDEKLLLKSFTVHPARLDYKSPAIQFHVAAQVGKADGNNCQRFYPNCLSTIEELLQSLRQGMSIDVWGESSDCSIYFLWRKNDDKKTEALILE